MNFWGLGAGFAAGLPVSHESVFCRVGFGRTSSFFKSSAFSFSLAAAAFFKGWGASYPFGRLSSRSGPFFLTASRFNFPRDSRS